MSDLPPELWLCVFHHAAHIPGALVPEIYAHASLVGPIHAKTCGTALRKTLVTTRALVRVCKQWWHLATPYLYQSVYIGRSRCLYSLSSTLVRSAAGKGTLVGTRPLGEYTQRIDIAIRDHSENPGTESDSLATLIACMPHLAIFSFGVTSHFAVPDLLNPILDALQHSAESLRVLDWSSTRFELSTSHIVDLVSKCTQLRILHCPRLVWSKELPHGGIPSTVTTLRLHSLFPVQTATTYNHLPLFDHSDACRSGPMALQELILDLSRDSLYWEDLLHAYNDQLVSVQLHVPSFLSIDVEGSLQLLTRTCPRLRRLTIIAEYFSSFIGSRSRLVFPSITYLGLRATRGQLPRSEFELLFAFLKWLRSQVPSLQVVQLLQERNVWCLLKSNTKYAMRALQPFTEAAQCRIEDKEGVLLTGSRSPVFGGHLGLIGFGVIQTD